jgi:hypothetical protein
MSKMKLLLIGGIGYVLGARAGRERYEQIKSAATKVRNNPQVQNASQSAVDLAKEKAPVVKDRLGDAAEAARHKVGGGSDASDQLNPDSTALQDDPYPKGDLP